MRTSTERPIAALVAILVLFGLLVLTSFLLDAGASPREDVSSTVSDSALADAD